MLSDSDEDSVWFGGSTGVSASGQFPDETSIRSRRNASLETWTAQEVME